MMTAVVVIVMTILSLVGLTVLAPRRKVDRLRRVDPEAAARYEQQAADALLRSGSWGGLP